MSKLTAEQEAAFAKDPDVLKDEVWEQWQKEHPEGTRKQFEDQWGAAELTFGF